MSRNKGKQGEREVAALLRDTFGIDARRAQQHKGGEESADVVGIDGLHIEVKRTERFNRWEALDQAEYDCGANVPLIAHRKSRKPWLLIIKAEDMGRFAAAVTRALREAQ
jgi:Holliday junction resolvase